MGQIQQLLGTGASSITWYQAALRAIIIYLATLVMVRIGEKRFLGKSTAFDVVVGIILGSLVSSAINTVDTILPTIVAGFVVVVIHRLFAVVTFHSDPLDSFFKGDSHQLVDNGKIIWDAMRENSITREDLIEQLRTVGHTDDPTSIQKAYFERSGEISVIKNNAQPKVLEVKVEDGIQIVRIILES